MAGRARRQGFHSLTEALAAVDIDVVVGLHPDRTARRGGDRGPGSRQTRDHRETGRGNRREDRQIIAAAAEGRHAGRGDLAAPVRPVNRDCARRDRQAGELGRLTTGIASIDWWRGQSYYDSGDWRGTWELDGGGALMNQGVHTVDLLVATMGRPVEVFAYTGTLAHERIEIEDVAVAVVRFENGALGVLHATTAAYPGLAPGCRCTATKGSVVIDDDFLTFIHATPKDSEAEEKLMGSKTDSLNQVDAYREAGQSGPTAGSDPGGLSTVAHRRQYENFLAALAGEEPLRVDLHTNRDSIAVITGAYESARTGKPVALS